MVALGDINEIYSESLQLHFHSYMLRYVRLCSHCVHNEGICHLCVSFYDF